MARRCKLPYHRGWCVIRHATDEERLLRAKQSRTRWLLKLKTYRPKPCKLSKHGLWCAHDSHDGPKKTPNPTKHFNVTPRRFQSEEERDGFNLVNSDLVAEIEALNAIYGPGTLQVLDVKDANLQLRLELPIGESAIFCISCSQDYPHKIPEVDQADPSLHQAIDRRAQNIFLITFAILNTVFVPGNVCFFDLIDTALPIIACLREQRFDENATKDFPFQINPQEWQWTRKTFIDMNSARTRTDCVICCDENYAFKMIPVPCKHFFCFDCFETGWDLAFGEGEPLTCCLENIPLELAKECLTVSDEQCLRYKQLLMEKSTPNPFFCGWKSCGSLIGSFSKCDLSRGRAKVRGIWCQLCRRNTCASCRERFHTGSCVEDNALKQFLEKGTGTIRRCPTCGIAIEKNGGCRHMKCIMCHSQWWWAENGELVDYGLHGHRIHYLEEDEQFLDDEGNAFLMQEAPVLDATEAARALQRIEMLRLQQQGQADQLDGGDGDEEVVEQEVEGDGAG